ncbi:BTAD domain-containing putative transcriptional regulator [Streptomyces sp. CSDS2]|uniref:AfsR/SARP family transcriptional regulator n=1 Tax=Streptomyces sp. CSDS2 TaxID=3055051 RepID=UPI0025B0ABF1|nr:BTAD domain-containing putative transcriptional regulator [Streptomyces sp. CSDS2]MDN3265534.1 BTAD domain-containing putative transcriptional regulator [Streptomyces sp. CSDS2]
MRESVSGDPELRFTLLGPVRAWRGEDSLATGSPYQRALLAALLLREGRTASTAELIDSLWGTEPPASALPGVRTYASRLRKVLGPGVVVSRSGGYAISALPEHAVDLWTAQSLAEEAERARAAGELGRARDVLGRALALWDGEPLAGVPGPYAQAQRIRLEEWRLQLLESRLDMDLDQGRHAEAVAELTALTAAHPLRERLRELLMLALYRSGRQAEALAVYADTRRLLAEELGVDPRPGLSDLQQRILQADPSLARPSAPVAGAAVVPVVPYQLPATVPDFTGRADVVRGLRDLIASGEDEAVAVSALAGIGGVGKTTLAVHVAHQTSRAFPDGQLWVDLQGTGSHPAEPAPVLGSFLRALGTPEPAVPDSAEERAALYRSLLRGRRVLVVLDNAKDAAQVRPLLPGTPGSAALVTSRVRMVDLAGARLVDLDVMSPEEALALFTRIVGRERVAAEREAAMEVVAACGHLPLAIRIAASRLAARRTWTVSVLAAKLADERRRLDELQAGDLAVKATFELGYGQLEPAQARAFRLLGLADGPDISLAAAAAVLDLPAANAEDLLESLVDASLLESAAPGRYHFQNLLRLYARACAERDEPPGEREAALGRLLDFYLATATRAYAIERPEDRLVDHLETAGHPGLSFADPPAARDWLYAEAGPLLSVVRQTARSPLLRRAVDTLWAALDLSEGSLAQPYEEAALALCDAARAAGDRRAEARALVTAAHAHVISGRFEAADEAAARAVELSADTDPLTTAWACDRRGVVAHYRGRLADGERHLARAADGFRACGDRPGEAAALSGLSRLRVADGRPEEAVRLARQGVEMYDAMGHALRGANARYALALALAASGEPDAALRLLGEALEVFRGSRQLFWQSMTHYRMAEIQLAQGAPAAAAASAEAALVPLAEVGGDVRRADALTLLGRALDRLGQSGRATSCWREALALYEKLGADEARDLRDLLHEGAASALAS